MQRYVSSVKSDISREMEIDELKRAGQQFRESVESTVSDVQQQTTVVDDYLREEASSISQSVTSIAEAGKASQPSEPVKKQAATESKVQQSLPLDEPDQNRTHAPAAVVETARSDSAGKPA